MTQIRTLKSSPDMSFVDVGLLQRFTALVCTFSESVDVVQSELVDGLDGVVHGFGLVVIGDAECIEMGLSRFGFCGRDCGSALDADQFGPDAAPCFLAEHLPLQNAYGVDLKLPGVGGVHVAPPRQALIEVLLVKIEFRGVCLAVRCSDFFRHDQSLALC